MVQSSHSPSASLPSVTFRNGVQVPNLGMGTWNVGENPALRAAEVQALRCGLDAGLKVIDTAEMYGHGRSESVVGEAIAGRRAEVYLVSKVLPSNASRAGVLESCRRSLGFLKTDYLDLYLLHWRSPVALEETVSAFEDLMQMGLIRGWGVSNFDVADMEALERVSPDALANQILYNLEERGTEFDLLARDAASGVVTMAYSPLGQAGALLRQPVLVEIASRHETSLGPATPAQIALAWVLRQKNMLAIPKAASVAHQKLNIAALQIVLTPQDLAALDRAFLPPRRKQSLSVI
ncbi:aldo/keto reductase [Oecophyllibacter saccharovorans]|uniref:aldo/keto reductase n=1 Tax=Oecophyllibacter saccharovorans TaxID=2558360 RepID=UPI001E42D392|nr:aldo/keto reductase [Oecophyllibacter saccharovorans]